MKIKEVRSAIRIAVARLASDTEVRTFDELLARADNLELTDFCKKISASLGKQGGVKKGVARSVDETVVRRYLEELLNTRKDTASFESVVRRAEKDKSVRANEAREIARQFTREELKHRTKRDAFKAILKRQMIDKRAEARAQQVSDLF